MNHESPQPWSQTVHDESMVVTSSGDDFTTNFLELDYPVFDDTSGLEDGQAGHDTPMGDLGIEQLGMNGSMGDGTTARTQHSEMSMEPSYPYMKSADAMNSDMHPQLLHHQQDHGHIMQNQNFQPQYTIPLTPHSCSEMHGTAGTYQRLMDMQSQGVYDRGHVSWTPLVSPAFSIPEYTVPGEYFSPLTSPIIRPQPRRQNTYPSAPSPDTGPTSPPIDPYLDTSKAAGASHSVAKKCGRRLSVSSRTPARSARQSPLSKSQGRRRPNSLNASSACIVRVASSNDIGARPAPLGHKPVSSSDGSGPDSVSPEPLTDILMPPPSIPRSAGRSPNMQADGKSPGNAPATPFTLLRRQGKGQTQFSPRTDQVMGIPAVEDGDFMLPEAATSARPALAIDTSKVNDVDQSAPPLSAKTPKLSANSTPRHTIMSPDILSPCTSTSQKLGDSKAASRNAKKRQSTSSAQISPMLVPKISPSIKPLIPSSGLYSNMNFAAYKLIFPRRWRSCYLC
jgi:hypothetical protein